MKRKQLTAILLSAALSVSTCLPVSGIAALAAEADADTVTIQADSEEPVPDSGIDLETSEMEDAGTYEEENPPVEEEIVPEEEGVSDEAEIASEEIVSDEIVSEEIAPEESVSPDEVNEITEPADGQEETETEISGEEESEVVPAEEPAGEITDIQIPEAVEEDLQQTDESGQIELPLSDGEEGQIITEEPVEEKVTEDPALVAVPEEDNFESAQEISSGDSIDVEVTEDNPYYFFKFTPAEEGTYVIYSESNEATYVDLFDSEYEQIA